MKPIRQDGSSADECEKLKIDLARAIATTLKRRDLAQVEAAKIIGVDESKVSALIRGRLTGYSVDRLVRYLIALGNDVDVQISGRGGNRAGRIKVVVT
jgi:predicted XRE-type DNA-binding protein